MASVRIAGAAMVTHLTNGGVALAMRLYAAMAGASLAGLILWQGFSTPFVAPQGVGIHFYQHLLGQLDGRSCPSYPVCSAYARQAIARHGLLLGSWLALDRLIHENNDLQQGIWRTVEGEQRLYDPLARNDFWLRRD